MNPPTETAERFPPLPEGLTSAPDAAEVAVLEKWRAERTFAALTEARRDAPPFVFWEGPPTANGRPGIHHVLSRTLKDTVCRFHTMLGKRVERKAGWDTHGLPVELEVEKALGISGKKQIEEYGVAEFNAKCRESVWKYREEWERVSERIGFWLDYDDPYVTYEPEYVDSVWNVLARFHGAGLVYRGNRILPYCGRCGTGLSSHELGQPGVYRDVVDPSVTIRFRLLDSLLPSALQRGHPEFLLAWTTTPWTLPSNFALAVHPEVEYEAWELPTKDSELSGIGATRHVVWMAAPLAADLVSKSGHADAVSLGSAKKLSPDEVRAALEGGQKSFLCSLKGRDLIGARYEPLFDHPIARSAAEQGAVSGVHRVYGAGFVTVEDGTGIVHQAPYGADDYQLAQENGIQSTLFMGVGKDGRFRFPIGPVAEGTFFKDADDALMDDLKGRGLLFKKAREPHSYPHCWRCDTPLYYFPAPAWYIRTTAFKDRMVERNRQIRWVPPEVGEKRFGEWLENNVDWNISRDRYWGTPLPFWVCEGCDADRAIGGVRELHEAAGGLPEGFDHHKPSIDEVTLSCADCGGTMRRTPSVLDCWFDSGSMPYAQHGWPHAEGSRAKLADQFAADFICEGLDQTRGWFYTLHAIGAFMTSLEGEGLEDAPAYKTCLVNGLVLDKDGVKMSKRLGNVIDPMVAIAEHGVDAVRWYMVSSAAPWLPKRFDLSGVVDVRRRFFSTLANSYQFFREYARVDGFDPADPAVPALAERPEIDRWLASRAQTLLGDVRGHMLAVDLTAAARAIEAFVVDELSNWYIRRNRRRFWKGAVGADKLAAFATLHGALETVALLVAPIAPFLGEMLWERLAPGRGSVHAALLPEPDPAVVDPALEEGMELVQRVVAMGRSLRERAGIKVRQPLRGLHLRASDPADLERLGTGFASSQILDELNVRGWGSLASDDGQLVSLSAKADFKRLGKRLGPRMKAAAAAIAGLGSEEVARLRGGQGVTLALADGEVALDPDDVSIHVECEADFDVEADGRVVLWLDTELDEELRAEGLAREVVIRVNGLRKERGLAVEDRIRLTLHAERADVAAALERHADLIAGETLAASIELAAEPPEGADVFELDGSRVHGSLSRA